MVAIQVEVPTTKTNVLPSQRRSAIEPVASLLLVRWSTTVALARSLGRSLKPHRNTIQIKPHMVI